MKYRSNKKTRKKKNMKKSKVVEKFEFFLKDLTYLYKVSLLEWIKKRKTITIFLLGTLALTIFFFNFTKKELIAHCKKLI